MRNFRLAGLSEGGSVRESEGGRDPVRQFETGSTMTCQI